MRPEKKEAVRPGTAKETYRKQSYPDTMDLSSAERIRKHRGQIPKIHRLVYDRAMQGKSLKSAVKSFCLECYQWDKEEVRACPSVQCPLHCYRPYKPQKQASQGLSFLPESTNSGKEVD